MRTPLSSLKTIVAVNTLAFHGYSLQRAFEQISSMGFECVEPALISGYYEEMTDAYFSQSRAKEMRRSIQASGLRVIALSAHMNLGLKLSVESFRKRMDFAQVLGASFIHTNGTSRDNQAILMRNLESLVPLAKANGLVITLKIQAMVRMMLSDQAKKEPSWYLVLGLPIFGSTTISNAYSYSKGKIDIDNDFQKALPFVSHIHLKDMRPRGTEWEFVPIGSGITDYRNIFKLILTQKVRVPMSIELPLHFKRGADYRIQYDDNVRPLSQQKICEIIQSSREFIQQHLQLLYPQTEN